MSQGIVMEEEEGGCTIINSIIKLSSARGSNLRRDVEVILDVRALSCCRQGDVDA